MEDLNEGFTPEELAILGEVEDEAGETSEEQGEKTEQEAEGEASEEEKGELKEAAEEGEEKTAEEEEEQEDARIPQSRLNEVVAQREEAKQKLDLFKRLGPDKYYEVYPDEKPKETDEGTKAPPLSRIPSMKEAGNMIVKGGEYDGKTLAEVYEVDSLAATDLYIAFREEQREQARSQEQEQTKLKEESERELNRFSQNLCQELYEKDIDALSDDEGKEIDKIIQSVLDWMEETGRGGGKVEDAYWLMNKDRILADAKEKGVKSFVKTLQKKTVPNVKGNKGGGAKTGYEAYEGMSENQLAETVANMSDPQFEKFRKDAPESFKKKFPGVDWD